MQFSCDDAIYPGDYQINYKLIILTIIQFDEDVYITQILLNV